jgi:hypothetical protein
MNRGAMQLAKALAERGARAELARETGWGPVRISNFVNGKRRLPNTAERLFLRDRYFIPLLAWDEPLPAPDPPPPDADAAEVAS